MFFFSNKQTISTFNFNVWLPVPIASFIILSFMTDLDRPLVWLELALDPC